LTDLDCYIPSQSDAADGALARCARLESLRYAYCYAPSAWLGLSQLHTLRGANLCVVSVVAIAAALPRLHTVEFVVQDGDAPPTAVAGFFEDLLPRLRAFHFHGPWPHDDQTTVVLPHQPRPLPFLQEFTWNCSSPAFISHSVLRGFFGAQPVTLSVAPEEVAAWLAHNDDAGACLEDFASSPPSPSLGRLRELCVVAGSLDGSDVARILRAAPNLRHFAGGWLRGGVSWSTDPNFAELVHPWLRSVHIVSARDDAGPPSADCASQLRLRHFPRLQQLVVDDAEYYVTP
jgi:hypothetical protein